MPAQTHTIYAPVTDFERAASYCPRKAAPRGWLLYLAWRILDEARDYFRTPIPEAFADKLARHTEAVFARHPFWQRKAAPRGGRRRTLQADIERGGQRQFQSQRGRDAILTSMRHWLASVLAKERPALFRDLPESFKVGLPLPKTIHSGNAVSVGRDSRRAGSRGRSPHRPVGRFVHGCELLAA